MNKYSKTDKKSILEGGASIGSGSALLRRSNKRGLLTGREKLYHGTARKNVEGILDQGIMPSKNTGVTKLTENVTKTPLDSDHLSFMTRNKDSASNYSTSSEMIDHFGPEVLTKKDMTQPEAAKIVQKEREFGRSQQDAISKKHSTPHETGVIEGKVPTWKLDEKENPEYQKLREKGIPAKGIKKEYKDSVFANEGTIPAKYLKGSKHYEANSLKEIGDYIRHSPGRFAKGVGLAGVGAGLIAYGATKWRNRNK